MGVLEIFNAIIENLERTNRSDTALLCAEKLNVIVGEQLLPVGARLDDWWAANMQELVQNNIQPLVIPPQPLNPLPLAVIQGGLRVRKILTQSDVSPDERKFIFSKKAPFAPAILNPISNQFEQLVEDQETPINVRVEGLEDGVVDVYPLIFKRYGGNYALSQGWMNIVAALRLVHRDVIEIRFEEGENPRLVLRRVGGASA